MLRLVVLLFLNLKISFERGPNKFLELNIICENKTNFCFIPVFFGSYSQPFLLQLDTTTGETWIPSIKFDLEVPKYNILKSKGGLMTNRSVEIEDDEGIIYGKLSYDSIKIDNIIINNYQFVLANEHDINFKDYPNGKLGLGIDKENKISFLSQLKQNNLIDNEIFIIDKISKKLIL